MMNVKEKNVAPEELNLPSPLRLYQWEGVNFLAQNHSVLMADEMGLGKTVQTAIALRLILRLKDCHRALIVVPTSLILNWEQELKFWAPDLSVKRVKGSAADRAVYYRLPIPVLIASYEQIRNDLASLKHPSIHFDVVVLDEAQRIKNINSSTAHACRSLPRTRAWALTGTPIENVIDDIVSIYQFLKPGLVSPGILGSELHIKIKDYFIRREKKDVLGELPPIIEQNISLELSGKQWEAYFDTWESRGDMARNEGVPVSNGHLFALIVKLKKLCNFEPESNESVKLNALMEILDTFSGPTDKIIIFSQYVETLEWLSKHLEHFPHELYHGKLPGAAREKVLKTFKTEPGPRGLFMSIKAGGVGLNLQEATTTVLFDRWWNPAVEAQAISRAHRFGREGPLHVIRFLVKDSIEEKIENALHEKQKLFERYVEQAEGAEIRLFKRDELRRILELGTMEIDDV